MLENRVRTFYWAENKLLDSESMDLARDYLKFKHIDHAYGFSLDRKFNFVIGCFSYGQKFLDSIEITFDELPDYIKTHILLMGYEHKE